MIFQSRNSWNNPGQIESNEMSASKPTIATVSIFLIIKWDAFSQQYHKIRYVLYHTL